MKEVNIKEEYGNLAKKYKIPKFEVLNEEFELDFIKEKQFLLRQVRRRINEKVIFFCRIVEGLLYPTPQNIVNATELNNFSNEKKVELEKIYKELMYYERSSLLLDVSPNEKKEIEYINSLFNFWGKIKKQVEETVRTMQESWKKDDKEEEKEKNNYFG